MEICLKFDDTLAKTSKIEPIRNMEKLLECAKSKFQRTDIDFVEYKHRQSADWIQVHAGVILHPKPGEKFKFQIVSKKVRLILNCT